jgi:hypothetical protein
LKRSRDQEHGLRRSVEGKNGLFVFEQEAEQLLSCAVAQAQPDKFGRRTEQEVALVEVTVLGNQSEPMVAGIFPNRLIRSTL